ncbi:MAG TPA: EAL domain-containing protein [Solirubrobacteraceae bacterium]|jgi:diguanylate cyclase (GGDEF)-like protein|nr:EAL domain-containing protein [Solirubrobacteraceae bacterium]
MDLSPWTWDVESDIVWCLPDLFSMNGLQRPIWATDDHKAIPVRRERWLATLPQERRERIREFGDNVIRTGGGGDLGYRVTVGNSIRWLSLYAAVGEVTDGKVRRVVGYTQDVTARKLLERRYEHAERDLEHQRQALERIAAGDPLEDTLDILCRQLERTYPGAFSSILLHDPEAGVLRHGVAPSLSRDYCAAMDGLVVGDGNGACGTAAARCGVVVVEDVRTDPLTASEVEIFDTYGLRSVWSYPLRGVGGDVLGTLALYRTEPFAPPEKEVKAVGSIAKLAALAIERDGLQTAIQTAASVYPATGLTNRTRFLQLVDQRLAEPLRRTAVLFVEVDRLKYLADDLGNVASASLLAEVSRRLHAAAGSDGVIGRFSGDEFLLAVDCASPEAMSDVVTRVQVAFSTPVTTREYELFLVATVGVAYTDEAGDAYGLVRDAAAAMHAARSDGLGGHRVYSRALQTEGLDLIGRESELRRAIDFGELILHYQPILEIANHRWDRLEALVRWNHPTRGLLAPAEFIPLAEKSGLIVPLGQRVLEIAARDGARWAAAIPGLRIAINVSVLQLADPDFADNVLALLDRAGLPPEGVSLEVAESDLVQKLDAVAPVLERLQELGIRTVVDDFGAGYSSLARLGQLPITSLKIDGSFVGGITTDPTARTVVRSIVDIARAHRLSIVAEGIEDAETLAAVEELGCDYAQGFHMAMPAPAEQVAAMLFEASSPAPLHLVNDHAE